MHPSMEHSGAAAGKERRHGRPAVLRRPDRAGSRDVDAGRGATGAGGPPMPGSIAEYDFRAICDAAGPGPLTPSMVRRNENGRREGARREPRDVRDQPPTEKVRTNLFSALSLPNTLSALLSLPT